MSKSILVIDTPKACIDCPCHFSGDTGRVWCGKEKKELLEDDIQIFKPDWCPLQDFESKEDCDYIEAYCNGWNDCIDELLRGDE